MSTQIKQAAFELASRELLASAIGQSADIEGVTATLLLTDEDHFNPLAATTLAGSSDTPVYLAPGSDRSRAISPTCSVPEPK
jgi:hypothetical protein